MIKSLVIRIRADVTQFQADIARARPLLMKCSEEVGARAIALLSNPVFESKSSTADEIVLSVRAPQAFIELLNGIEQ